MSIDIDRSTWKRVRFGDVVSNINENVAKPVAAGIDRSIGLEHLDPGEIRVSRWGDIEEGSTFTRRVKTGQTLFGKRRAYQRKTAFADFDAVCSGDILVFEPTDPEVLLPDLLPFIASTDAFYDTALRTSAGSLSPRTKWADLAKHEFDLPPLDEQRRIADLLWSAADHVRTLRAALLHAAFVKKQLINTHFGSGDDTTPLAEFCLPNGIRTGPFGSQLHAYEYTDEGVPVVMPQDMQEGRLSTENIARIPTNRADDLAEHRLKAGDLLVPRRGELDRRAKVEQAEEGWICGTGTIRIRPRQDVSSDGLFYALSSDRTLTWLRAHATGTTMPNLNRSTVAALPVTLPAGEALIKALRLLRATEGAIAGLLSECEHVASLQSDLRRGLALGGVA